jgi:hypothetical protein
VLSVLFEEGNVIGKTNSKDGEAVRTAIDRYAAALKLKILQQKPEFFLTNLLITSTF